jgi:hypothetical protein
LENKITGRESQGACSEDELIGGKPPVVKWLTLISSSQKYLSVKLGPSLWRVNKTWVLQNRDLRAIFGLEKEDLASRRRKFPNKKLCNLFIITMIIKVNDLT